MKRMLLLFALYTLPSVTADKPKPELKLRYINSTYGVLGTQWEDNKLGFYISDGVNKPTKITEFNGFVSISVSQPMSLKSVATAICAKMQKRGQLYYLNAYHQLRDISNDDDSGFSFPMPKGPLRELGSQLFFVVDPATPYTPDAQ